LEITKNAGKQENTQSRKMSEETMTSTHLGPFDVSDVNNDILGDMVHNKGVPIIVKQTVDNETVFAVLAKNKDVRIACAGCFKRDMRITGATGCKKCASFVEHWDTKDGLGRVKCQETGSEIRDFAADCRQVTTDFLATTTKRSKPSTRQI